MARTFGTRNVLVMLLTPVVRWALKHSVSVATIIECLKEAAISITASDLERSGVAFSVSKISVATGLTRREVTRLHRSEGSSDDVPGILGRVLVQWEQDKRYLGTDGKPRRLHCKGRNSEFHQLVSRVSKDINPATVLFELTRIGACVREEDEVTLVRTIQYHTDTAERMYDLLMRSINTEIKALEHNIYGKREERNLYLRTEFDNIFQEDLPTIRAWMLEKGAKFHKEARDFLSNFDQDLNPSEDKTGGGKVVLSAFSWIGEKQGD